MGRAGSSAREDPRAGVCGAQKAGQCEGFVNPARSDGPVGLGDGRASPSSPARRRVPANSQPASLGWPPAAAGPGQRPGDQLGDGAVTGQSSAPAAPAAASRLPLALEPVDEARLDELARRARHDPEVRNALYWEFAPFCQKVARRVARYRWVRLAELTDIEQEGFCVFCELLASWSERGSFAGYVFACFERRLRSAVRRLEGLPRRRSLARRVPRTAGESAPAPLRDRLVFVWLPLAEAGALGVPWEQNQAGREVTVDWLELLAGLAERDRALLELLAAGYRFQEVAQELGCSPRTLRRRLRRLRAWLTGAVGSAAGEGAAVEQWREQVAAASQAPTPGREGEDGEGGRGDAQLG